MNNCQLIHSLWTTPVHDARIGLILVAFDMRPESRMAELSMEESLANTLL
jgi:hypothetical protein